jgi:hypothetical protein
MVGYSQVLPYGEPKYFTLNPETVVRHASFTDGNFDILKSIWMNGTKTKNGNQALYFLHFTIGKESTFHALLDKKSFPEECELYLINPTEKSWVGPYRKEYLSREVPNFTGRVNASEILIEFAVPLTKEIKFPVISIQNIPSNSNQLESIPPYIRNPKSTRDDPVILLTGYWPPTNEAVRPFSQNPILNPEGWIGEDWEGFGFDIVSYFPTFFPPDCESCGQGSGDLEVDYQDTSEDWWNIVDSLNPISIITFSRGYINYSWELEFKYYNWQNWIDDFTPPYQPTPSPPDQNSPPNHMRFSSLPMNEIVDAVNASDLGLNSYIDYAGGAGQYLSEFKGFHGVWYKDLMEYEEQTPCYLAGHVHVGGMIDWDTAHEAVLITVRETIQYIQENILSPGDVNQDGSINSLDINMVISHLNGTTELTENQFYYADMDEDSNITFHDVILLVNILLTQN